MLPFVCMYDCTIFHPEEINALHTQEDKLVEFLVSEWCCNVGVPAQPGEDCRISCADTPTGSCVVLASARMIWVLRPVAPEMQALQLLRARSYSAALSLAEQCTGADLEWVNICFAQAGLLLIQGL